MRTRLSLCIAMVCVLAVVAGAAWAVPTSAGAAGSATGAYVGARGYTHWDVFTQDAAAQGGAAVGAYAATLGTLEAQPVASVDGGSASLTKGSVGSGESKFHLPPTTPELPSCALLLCALAPLAWAGMRARAKQRR